QHAGGGTVALPRVYDVAREDVQAGHLVREVIADVDDLRLVHRLADDRRVARGEQRERDQYARSEEASAWHGDLVRESSWRRVERAGDRSTQLPSSCAGLGSDVRHSATRPLPQLHLTHGLGRE